MITDGVKFQGKGPAENENQVEGWQNQFWQPVIQSSTQALVPAAGAKEYQA